VFNALHGHYGEDGKVQQLLERLRLPYTGSSPTASALSMNKILSKKTFGDHHIKTPYFTIVRREDNLAEKVQHAFNTMLLPLMVKPATGTNARGITLVTNYQHLEDALHVALSFSEAALIEEYIKGIEVNVGVIRGFRSEPLYVLLPVSTSSLSESEKIAVQKYARQLHETLNLGQYSRTDMMVHPRRGVFVLETNTQPHIHEGSAFYRGLEAVGCSPQFFIEHVLHESLK
jgi:D-alanine-D-alanine ligase